MIDQLFSEKWLRNWKLVHEKEKVPIKPLVAYKIMVTAMCKLHGIKQTNGPNVPNTPISNNKCKIM